MRKIVDNKLIKRILIPIFIGGSVGGFVGEFLFPSRDGLFSMMVRIVIMTVAIVGSVLIAKAIGKRKMSKEA